MNEHEWAFHSTTPKAAVEWTSGWMNEQLSHPSISLQNAKMNFKSRPDNQSARKSNENENCKEQEDNFELFITTQWAINWVCFLISLNLKMRGEKKRDRVRQTNRKKWITLNEKLYSRLTSFFLLIIESQKAQHNQINRPVEIENERRKKKRLIE
jgi:hypothetical protein